MSTYERESAALLLSRLDACQGARTTYYDACDASRIGTDRDTVSDYPAWYSAVTSRPHDKYGKLDGDNIRAALAALAHGSEPNMKQQEARWIREALAHARMHGDATLGLPPENRGGGKRGVTQARVLRREGTAVSRVPLRLRADILGTLRDVASREGVSLNGYIEAVLTLHVEAIEREGAA